MKSRTDPIFLPVYGVIGLIALWYLAVWVKEVDPVLLPPPEDAVGPPVRRNSQLRLWRLRRTAPDRTSRRMVPIFARNVPLQTRGG